MRKVNRAFVQPTGFGEVHRANVAAKRAAFDAATFEMGDFNDGIASNEDWSRNDTRRNPARHDESDRLLHQLTYGPRLRRNHRGELVRS